MSFNNAAITPHKRWCGAATEDRWTSLKRRASAYKPTGVECKLVSPEEIQELHPYVNTDGIHGGVYMPDDACVNAEKVSKVFALEAQKGGAKFVSDCGVKKVLTKGKLQHFTFKLITDGYDQVLTVLLSLCQTNQGT